jgi:hypothetical protein
LILDSCNPDGCFDPVLWGLPNIRTQPFDPELDHDWYEFFLWKKPKRILPKPEVLKFFWKW